MRWRSAVDDRGSVTAELAAAMPAVLLVLSVCLGALVALGQQALLADLAGQSARAVARGEPAELVLGGGSRTAGVALTTTRRGDLVCVTATSGLALPAFADLVAVSGEGCALDGGW